MTVLEIIKKRYSCRSYKEQAIEREKLEQILEAARLAPSAKNLQDWRFVVVTDSETKVKLAASTNQSEVFSKAGVIIVACSNSDMVMTCGQAIGPIDVSIALEHMCLQATELGLGSCWIGAFNAEKVRGVLGIPDDISIIELMAIGYAADKAGGTRREAIGKIVCYERWDF